MVVLDSEKLSKIKCWCGMMSLMEVHQLLKKNNHLLYTILEQRGTLECLIEQLYETINIHFCEVLKEVLLEYPIQPSDWLGELQQKEHRVHMAREISMEWVMTLKVLKPKYIKEYL